MATGDRDLFTTRPATHRESTPELRDVMAKRREAYQSHRSAWAYGRKHGGVFFIVDLVLCPFFAALSALQVLGSFAWSGFTAVLSCLMQPHFWLGLLMAFLLSGMIIWGSCAEDPAPPRLRLVCSFESPLALQVWEVLKSTSTSISLSWLWLAGYLREMEHRMAVSLLGGRCPFRDVEEARAACQSRPDLVLVRHAKDCAALRKAYHDGQRQVHPDLLRLQHPACSGDILQALFSEKPELELMINQKEYIRLQELFKKERLSGLERQVANFTQKLEEITNQVTLLEAENEKLAKRHAKEMRRTSSTSSPGTSSRTLQDHRRPSGAATSPTQRGSGESSARQVATPVGKPKAGRPKRGVKYSRPGREAGDSSDA